MGTCASRTPAVDQDLIGLICSDPDCNRLVMVTLGTRGPVYCDDKCEAAADEAYSAAQERVSRQKDQLTRSRYWLASFQRGDAAPYEGPNQHAREAIAAAQGALEGLGWVGGPQTDRERWVAEALAELVNAVRPLVDEATGAT